MYGFLVWKEDKSIDTIFNGWMQYAKISVTSKEAQIQGANAAFEVFSKLCPTTDPLRKQLNPEDVKKLFSRFSANDRSFGISLWLAHQRLPKPLRDVRTAAIEKIVDDQLGDLYELDELKQPIAHMKNLGLLVADDLMGIDLRDQGSLIANEFLPKTTVFRTSLEPALREIMTTVKNRPLDQLQLLQSQVWLLTCYREGDQREVALKQLLTLFKQSKSQLILDAVTSVRGLKTLLPGPIFYDALGQMVADALASEADSHQEIIESRLNMANELYASQKNKATTATMDAAAAGVPMGDKTPGNQEAIINFERERNLQNRKRTRESLQRARNRKGGTPTQGTAAQQAEAAAMQAWPLQQLAQWIEGPITEKRTARGGIDRKAILLNDQKPQAPQARKPPPTQKAPPPDELTLDDVDNTIQQALSGTADFFMSEIGDMLMLAKQLEAHPDLVDGCHSLLEPLQVLATSTKPLGEEEATSLLAKAETTILELRAGLKSASSSAKLQRGFPAALIAALRAESLELGKRRGGQIGYKTHPADWTFVCDNFHNRWLPQVKSIKVNGILMQLQTNQAVALYVTGSSQSGYAFDVSVHLWQRRLGKQSTPSASNDLYPPMNQEDWFDTHVPCCVLHVPSAE